MNAKELGNMPEYPSENERQTGSNSYHYSGLTKREAFAMAAIQPGVAEMVEAAGLVCKDGLNIYADEETRIGTFSSWWAGLTNQERYRLVAICKFQEAEAMLAEAAKDQP